MTHSINSPHDRFFRATFSDKEAAIGFFQNYLPADVAAKLNFDTLTVENTTFVDESLQEYRSDLLYQIELKDGSPANVYILFEHQSTPDALMPFRLLSYMVNIWEYQLKKLKRKRLAPVIPIVLSQSGWPYSPYFQDMFDLDSDTKASLSPWLPSFTHLLVDLSTLSSGRILGSVYRRITLSLLKSGRDQQWQEVFRDLNPLLKDLLKQDSSLKLLETLLRYSMQVADSVTLDQFREIVVENLDETTGGKMATVMEQMEQAGEAKIQAAQAAVRLVNEEKEALTQEKEALTQDNSTLTQDNSTLIEQLRAAGIEPNIKH